MRYSGGLVRYEDVRGSSSDRSCEPEIWGQGTFGLSSGTLESLVSALDRFDFAVLVVSPDDTVASRGNIKSVPRDNIIFGLGLFMGALGRDRTFDRTRTPNLSSDLAGVTAATYEPARNLEAALGAACAKIERAINRLGLRDVRHTDEFAAAADSVRTTSDQMERLVRLLARSRKVELDIIAAQFGPLIDVDRLAQMQADLEDLGREMDEP